MPGERYSLALVESGSLLLDVASGGLFSLNQSATLIWSAHLRGSTRPEIAGLLSETFGIDLTDGIEQVEMALDLDRHEESPTQVFGDFRYEKSPDGYALKRGPDVMLCVNDEGNVIRLPPGAPDDRVSVSAALQAIAPKLLALHDHVVLHASAVLMGGTIIAFCGESGAGKTTTARSLQRAGAKLVSEDKLVIRVQDRNAEALIGAEDAIRTWTEAATAEMLRVREMRRDDLDRVDAMQPFPISEIGFISAARRSGRFITAVDMTPLDTASATFRNAFYGTDLPDHWSRRLQSAAKLALTVRGYSLTLPGGLEALEAATPGLVRRKSLRAS